MPKAQRIVLAAITLAFLPTLFSACGYRPLTKMDQVPGLEGRQPLAVHMPMWANASNEFGLESAIFNKVADWLQGSEQILLKKSAGEAQYILNGSISKIDLSSSRGTVRLTVRYALINQATGKAVWPETRNTFTKSYLITADALTTNSERQIALAEIADDLGEKLYIRFLNNLQELRGPQVAPAN